MFLLMRGCATQSRCKRREIHFPNLNDVEEFKKTVRDCGLKETEDGFKDSEDIYWAGTDVSFKGTIVTLSYKFEP